LQFSAIFPAFANRMPMQPKVMLADSCPSLRRKSQIDLPNGSVNDAPFIHSQLMHLSKTPVFLTRPTGKLKTHQTVSPRSSEV